MLIVIDNYDSFTYNLVQYIREIGEEVIVYRNDRVTLKQIEDHNPDYILISPGPGSPDTAGICLDAVNTFYKKYPIFGVCLGQQIIAQAFGGKVKKAIAPMHGKVSFIEHDQKGVFDSLPTPMQVARYHSLIVDEESLPDCLEISAKTGIGEVMAIRHKIYPVEGVQFHPEAILTEYGLEMVRNFFKKTKDENTQHDSKKASLII